MLSGNGKNASEAKIESLDKYFLDLFTAKFTLLIRFGCPEPIPIIDFSSVMTIAFDFTNFVDSQANFKFSISFLVGLILD